VINIVDKGINIVIYKQPDQSEVFYL